MRLFSMLWAFTVCAFSTFVILGSSGPWVALAVAAGFVAAILFMDWLAFGRESR